MTIRATFCTIVHMKPLTEREKEALRLIAKGCRKAAARSMGITPDGVTSFQRSACRKLGLNTTNKLALLAAAGYINTREVA